MTPDIDVEVALVLTGHQFLPDEITRMLGIMPTKTWRAGDVIGKTILTRQDDGWVFGLPKIQTVDLGSRIEQLLDILGPVSDNILEAMIAHALDAEITCAVYASTSMPAINLSPNTIARLSQLNTSLDVDIILV